MLSSLRTTLPGFSRVPSVLEARDDDTGPGKQFHSQIPKLTLRVLVPLN